MKQIATPPETKNKNLQNRQWVQTERKSHEEWGRLITKKPAAGALLHILVAKMKTDDNAIVISQQTLAELVGVSDRTIRTALADLEAGRWIQIIRIGKGREAAYKINDRVAWDKSRKQLAHSGFSATVYADARDQTEATLNGPELQKIPRLYAGELQLPTGPGEDPPSQPAIEGLEHDLPAVTINTGIPDLPNPFAQITEEQAAIERGRIYQIGLDKLTKKAKPKAAKK